MCYVGVHGQIQLGKQTSATMRHDDHLEARWVSKNENNDTAVRHCCFRLTGTKIWNYRSSLKPAISWNRHAARSKPQQKHSFPGIHGWRTPTTICRLECLRQDLSRARHLKFRSSRLAEGHSRTATGPALPCGCRCPLVHGARTQPNLKSWKQSWPKFSTCQWQL